MADETSADDDDIEGRSEAVWDVTAVTAVARATGRAVLDTAFVGAVFFMPGPHDAGLEVPRPRASLPRKAGVRSAALIT